MPQNVLERAIALCMAVYRVTDRLPAAETLRFNLRRISLDIIKDLVYNRVYPTGQREGRIFGFEGLEKRIKLLLMYCKIAKKQNWVDPRNFEVLSYAYRDFCGYVRGFTPHVRGETPHISETRRGPKIAGLNPRRLKIVKFLESCGGEGASMADFAQIIKGKSRKTIERDLKYLIGANLVLKKGRTKGARFFKT